jgi:beta-glucanase (GH16 family)
MPKLLALPVSRFSWCLVALLAAHLGACNSDGGGAPLGPGSSVGGSGLGGTGGTPATGGTPGTGGEGATGGEGGMTTSAAGEGGTTGAVGGSAGQPSDAGGAAGNGGASGTGGNGDAGIKAPSGYRLVWSDEFSTPGRPNPANWGFEKGFSRNEELQWYQEDNATVRDGKLIIEARRERKESPWYRPGSAEWRHSRKYIEYTSSSLISRRLREFKFGIFEMRGRIDVKQGIWPAWWTLGVSGEWPSNGEIDIMEYYAGKIRANVASGTAKRWEPKWDSVAIDITTLGANWSSEFHVWQMNWNDEKIDLYLDGTRLNRTLLKDALNPDGTSPFRQKHYMILNLALGGLGGLPPETAFPRRFVVDYVRVFQKL